MPVGFPAKTSYVNGDVFSASDINDTNGTLNLLNPSGNFSAGKNKIINGDFLINQRNFTSTVNNGYCFDRWIKSTSGVTGTVSPQVFTPGTAPVAGYEGTNFLRLVTLGQVAAGDSAQISQFIEDVRTFAGQTITVSFWAKANTGTPKVYAETYQIFGTGGSGAVIQTGAQVTLSTSWARYSVTITVPSISGKTIGTNSYFAVNFFTSAGSSLNSRTNSLGLQNFTFDIWGVQAEAGSTATAFQTATGTIQGELAACQRYYWRFSSDGKAYASLNTAGYFSSTTQFLGRHQYPVIMRTNPTVIDAANLSIQDTSGTLYAVSAAAIDTNTNTSSGTSITYTVAGATSARFGSILVNNNTGAYIGLGAEL